MTGTDPRRPRPASAAESSEGGRNRADAGRGRRMLDDLSARVAQYRMVQPHDSNPDPLGLRAICSRLPGLSLVTIVYTVLRDSELRESLTPLEYHGYQNSMVLLNPPQSVVDAIAGARSKVTATAYAPEDSRLPVAHSESHDEPRSNIKYRVLRGGELRPITQGDYYLLLADGYTSEERDKGPKGYYMVAVAPKNPARPAPSSPAPRTSAPIRSTPHTPGTPGTVRGPRRSR